MRESIYQIEASGTGVRREGPPLHALETLVDLHCHCLPGFDDGPESYGQAVALRRTLTQHSIRTVIATPHQSGGFEGRTAPDEIRIAVRRLNRRLGNEDINLTVFPGTRSESTNGSAGCWRKTRYSYSRTCTDISFWNARMRSLLISSR